MTSIRQSSFAAVMVPIGGTIRETVGWEASVPGGATFDFYIFSVYGHDVDGTIDNFSQVFSGYITTGPIGSMSRPADTLDMVIPSVPLDTYDCLTMIGDYDGTTVYAFDYVIDTEVLIVETPLGATITSTGFTII